MSIVFLSLYVLFLFVSPFPLWSTYFRLWKHVLFSKTKGIPLKLKISQALFLIRYLLLSPVYSLFWYIDEFFYSDYLKKDLPKVVAVISQPRSGTTFLHRTLASDEESFFAVRHVEWRFPFICVQKFLKLFNLYNFVCGINYWPKTKDGENASDMHRNYLGDWEEDGIFFEERFLYHYFIYRRFPYPEVVKETHDFQDLSGRERDHFLNIHKKVIRKVFYLRGTEDQAVLLKENETMTIMPMLQQSFSDVKYIFIGRKSKDSLSSYDSLSRRSTLSKTGIDPIDVEGWYDANMWKRDKECRLQIDFLEDLEKDKQVRVTYDSFASNPPEAVGKIYKAFNLEINATYKIYLDELLKKQSSRERDYETLRESPIEIDFFDNFISNIDKE